MIQMDVDDPRAKYVQVFLNGEDVTLRTFYFEGPDQPGQEGEGRVEMYVVDGDNRIKVLYLPEGDPEVETETRQGLIRWEMSER